MPARSQTKAAPQADAKSVLNVTTKRDGFRRAGRAWSGTTKVLKGELTDEQIAQLKADPMFIVGDL